MNDNYLMHYGIKGMKWGVRKAIQKGDAKRLARNYSKAQKKLNRLNEKADISAQKAESRKYAKRALIGGSLGIAGIGVGSAKLVSTFMKARKAGSAIGKGVNGLKIDTIQPRFIREHVIPEKRIHEDIITEHKISENMIPSQSSLPASTPKRSGSVRNGLRKASIVAGLGALSYSGYAGGRSLAAKRRTTAKGHAKAVAKRDAFRKEMNAAFSQPGINKLPSKTKKRSRSRKG